MIEDERLWKGDPTAMGGHVQKAVPPSRTRSENPVVFLEFSTHSRVIGRVILELRQDVCPTASENFRALVTGKVARQSSSFFPNQPLYKATRPGRVFRPFCVPL